MTEGEMQTEAMQASDSESAHNTGVQTEVGDVIDDTPPTTRSRASNTNTLFSTLIRRYTDHIGRIEKMLKSLGYSWNATELTFNEPPDESVLPTFENIAAIYLRRRNPVADIIIEKLNKRSSASTLSRTISSPSALMDSPSTSATSEGSRLRKLARPFPEK